MDKTPQTKSLARSSWIESLLGILPILTFGLATVLNEAGFRWLLNGFMAHLTVFLILLLVAGVAWYKGSPRWSYANTGFLVLFTLYRMNFELPVIHFLGMFSPGVYALICRKFQQPQLG